MGAAVRRGASAIFPAISTEPAFTACVFIYFKYLCRRALDPSPIPSVIIPVASTVSRFVRQGPETAEMRNLFAPAAPGKQVDRRRRTARGTPKVGGSARSVT